MTFEQRVETALRSADRFEPSPDLFAKVQRSIAEDARHRRWLARLLMRVGLAVAAVGGYLLVTLERLDGVWSMPYVAFELLVTAAMVTMVIVVGPFIRKFGEMFEQSVFGAVPDTGKDVLRLLDIAYYLIFGAFTLMTISLSPPFDVGDSLVGWIQWAQFRIGGLLLLIGVLHVVLIMSLPVVGLVHAANRRRIRMADGALSGDQGLDKLDTAINVASWILADLLLLLLVGLVILVVGGMAGSG